MCPLGGRANPLWPISLRAGSGGGWLDRFITGRAKEKNLRVDFITVHWHGPDFSAAARDRVES